jgi:hypothetical protein
VDGPTNETTHHLLLALAGRVDDDLLRWARELAAVGEEARAVSLLTAEIAASRTPLPSAAHASLVAAGQAVRVDIDPGALAPATDDDPCEHRFVADVAGQPDVAEALRGLPPRRLQGCTVHLAWRLTPAGAAPGPLPHPVVLVETEPGARALDVLAYQVATGLVRAGVHAGVEVLAVGEPREAYHELALADALPVAIDGPSAPRAAAPVEEPVPVEAAAVAVEPEPAPAELDDTPPAQAVTDVFAELDDEHVDDPTEEREQAVEPVPDEDEVEEPPAEAEFVFDATRPHPLSDDAIQPPTRPFAVSPPVSPPVTRPTEGAPALSALNDPLSGPIDQPLLPPRFDPTIQPHDPLGIDYLIGPSESARRAAEAEAEVPPEPEAVETPAFEDSWAAEWESGAWAMPPEKSAEKPAEKATGDTPYNGFSPRYPDTERSEPGSGFVPAPAEPAHDQHARHVRPAEHEPARPPLRPEPPQRRAERPESGNRLTDADRELLARLQAELVDGRKPRVTRRAGVSRIQPVHNNGTNPDDDPPDLAG